MAGMGAYALFVMHLAMETRTPMQLADIGPFLREARNNARLSQEQLAAPLGMSRATVSAIESGRCQEIGFSKLVALLDMVGLELTIIPRASRPTIDDLRNERRSR
jgi:transcriptional regulator with XRE-family HTH domain